MYPLDFPFFLVLETIYEDDMPHHNHD